MKLTFWELPFVGADRLSIWITLRAHWYYGAIIDCISSSTLLYTPTLTKFNWLSTTLSYLFIKRYPRMGTFDLVLDVLHSRRTTYRRRTKNTRHDLLKRDHQACSTHQWVPPYTKYKLVNYSIILRSRFHDSLPNGLGISVSCQQ